MVEPPTAKPSLGPVVPMLPLDDARAAAEMLGMVQTYVHQPVWRVLLSRPRFARAWYDALSDLRFRSVLGDRIFEFAIMRHAWATKSGFEWAQHWRIAVQRGVPEADLLNLRSWESATCFDARERIALQAVDDLVSSGAISSETTRQASESFSSDELYELVAVVATYASLGIFVRCLDIPLDDDLSPWPPDGHEPG